MKAYRSSRTVFERTALSHTLFFASILCLGLMIHWATISAQPGSGTRPVKTPEHQLGPTEATSLDPIVSEIGRISWSIDGLGTLEQTGIIQVQKPAGATLRSAHFFSATTGFTNHQLQLGDVKIDGVDINWDTWHLSSAIGSYNYYADVTGMIRSKINTAPAGLINFEITELQTDDIDGEILAVIFNDPNQTDDVTVMILFGAQSVGGDQFMIGLAEPLDLSDPNSRVHMSLGISYGYQYAPLEVFDQYSLVDVNGSRLTSSAGGMDDGISIDWAEYANGALLTVGGLNDNPANPPDPNAPPTNFDSDDELYDLKPFVHDGDLQIVVETENPSTDDNIFFSAFILSVPAIIGEGCLLSPSEDSNLIGTQHTVTATLQDDDGIRITGRQINFEVTSGPHQGQSGSDMTNANGQARFTYTGTSAGTDSIKADFINSLGLEQTAENVAVKRWYDTLPTDSCEITVSPNPFTPNDDGFNDAVHFRFTSCRLDAPALLIFNMHGREILSLSHPSGEEFIWDGKDEDGDDQKPGVYLYLLQDGSTEMISGTVVLAR
jgi:hypothetical protein